MQVGPPLISYRAIRGQCGAPPQLAGALMCSRQTVLPPFSATRQEATESDVESHSSLDSEDLPAQVQQRDRFGFHTPASFALHLRRSRGEVPQPTEAFGSNDCLTNAMLQSLAAYGLLARHLTAPERRQYCRQARLTLNALADKELRPVYRSAAGVALAVGPNLCPPLEHGP